MRNGYIIDTIISVNIQGIVQFGGKVIQIYEGVIYRKNFKGEHNDLMQGLVKLNRNSLYGVQIGRDINDFYKCKSENWMQTGYDDYVLDYWRLSNGSYIVNKKRTMV